ncbi:hypothetical protein V1477_015913 [Vespula maculifrons]|uniref:Uncharacterized protein n=1 Tax=Vespula maculifrons TaxID=7453 RepID=A0ABD2BBI8_VESMC
MISAPIAAPNEDEEEKEEEGEEEEGEEEEEEEDNRDHSVCVWHYCQLCFYYRYEALGLESINRSLNLEIALPLNNNFYEWLRWSSFVTVKTAQQHTHRIYSDKVRSFDDEKSKRRTSRIVVEKRGFWLIEEEEEEEEEKEEEP